MAGGRCVAVASVDRVPAPFVHRLRVRYNECDAQGVVFNANWFLYFDIALTELQREAFGSYQAMVDGGADLVVAEASARFLAPGRFEDELDLAWTIVKLGNTSMTSRIDVMRDGEKLVEGQIRHVFVTPNLGSKTPIPDAVRERLAEYV